MGEIEGSLALPLGWTASAPRLSKARVVNGVFLLLVEVRLIVGRLSNLLMNSSSFFICFYPIKT